MKPLWRIFQKTKDSDRYEKDENGNIILSMTVRDDTDFLSPYSFGDNPVISGDVADFLDSRTSAMPQSEGLTLRIHSDCIAKEEKPLYEKAIREYYRERFAANARELRHNALLASVFAIIGITVLALLVLFAAYLKESIWTEVIDIVAWVFLWEATDLYFLQNRDLKQERKRLRALIAIKIEYIEA